jgi:hypothetical protein
MPINKLKLKKSELTFVDFVQFVTIRTPAAPASVYAATQWPVLVAIATSIVCYVYMHTNSK